MYLRTIKVRSSSGALNEYVRVVEAKGVPFTDRAFVLMANRLIRPSSKHGLAG